MAREDQLQSDTQEWEDGRVQSKENEKGYIKIYGSIAYVFFRLKAHEMRQRIP